MKKLLIILIFTISIFAWERDYSFGYHHLTMMDIIQLSDSTFVFVGTNITEDPSSNFIVFRFDRNGDSLWIDYIGHPEVQNYGRAAMNISDSTFVVTGGYDEAKPALFCYKYNREIHWMRVDSPLYYLDMHSYGTELEYDIDSNIVSNAGGDFTAFDIATGDTTWSRGFEYIAPFTSLDMEVVHTEPFGYARAGYYRTDIPSDRPGSSVKYFACIAFYDTLGDTLWQRNYPTEDSTDYQEIRDFEVIDNPAPGMLPGFIAVGRIRHLYTYGYIVRTDINGNIIWDREFLIPGIDSGGSTEIWDLTWAGNEPHQASFTLTGVFNEPGIRTEKPFLMKISDTLEGEQIWTRTYGDFYERVSFPKLCLCNDGGYMLIGTLPNPSPSSCSGSLWFCRVDSLGYPLPISSVQEHEDYSLPSRLSAEAYPNPFNSKVDIKIEGIEGQEDLSISIYDITGNKITTLESPKSGNIYKWNGRDAKGNSCPTGAYMYNVNYKDEKITGKILYLK